MNVGAFFKSFAHRSQASELMDDKNSSFAEFSACLHDLRIVNICTLAYRPILQWIRRVTSKTSSERQLSLLDVGSGGGDTLQKIATWARTESVSLKLTGMDLNPWAKLHADEFSGDDQIVYATADIRDLQSDQTFDYIVSSLFTHHLKDDEIVAFLIWMEQFAKRGWFINDLHRHPLPYLFIKYVSRLLKADKMVQHDGPVSVARAFRKQDWVNYLTLARIPERDYKIKWVFPFRYCVERQK